MMDNWGFSFAGRTIDYFGSKAITSDITALFELIKNSRDANAKKVTIHFKDLGKKNAACIEVYDDGDGMSEDDVKEKWMVLGTDSRLHDDKTKNGKPVWGEMGIGRMSCQKLGSKTGMISVRDKQRVKMSFDWSVFEKPGITVDKITFPVEARHRYWHIQKADRDFFPESDVIFKLKFNGKTFEMKVNHKDDIMTGQLYHTHRFLEGDRIIVTTKKNNVYELSAPDTELYPEVD